MPTYVRSIALTPDIGQVILNGENALQLTPVIVPTNADNKTIVWNSSNTDVIRVTSEGLVTASGEGYASVFAITIDGAFIARCDIQVIIGIESIQLIPNELFLSVGETFEILAEVLPDNAADRTVNFTSNNTAVATVAPANGFSTIVTGRGVGQTLINGISPANASVSDTCAVTVVNYTFPAYYRGNTNTGQILDVSFCPDVGGFIAVSSSAALYTSNPLSGNWIILPGSYSGLTACVGTNNGAYFCQAENTTTTIYRVTNLNTNPVVTTAFTGAGYMTCAGWSSGNGYVLFAGKNSPTGTTFIAMSGPVNGSFTRTQPSFSGSSTGPSTGVVLGHIHAYNAAGANRWYVNSRGAYSATTGNSGGAQVFRCTSANPTTGWGIGDYDGSRSGNVVSATSSVAALKKITGTSATSSNTAIQYIPNNTWQSILSNQAGATTITTTGFTAEQIYQAQMMLYAPAQNRWFIASGNSLRYTTNLTANWSNIAMSGIVFPNWSLNVYAVGSISNKEYVIMFLADGSYIAFTN